MNYLKFISSAISVATVLCASAAPRSQSQMRQAATRVLSTHVTGKKNVPAHQIEMVANTDTYSVYETGSGFAIISADDLLPEVLAYSNTSSFQSSRSDNRRNDGFEWWLKATNEAASAIVRSGKRHVSVKPDVNRFSARVEPMVTCTWGQEEPYWNDCPWGTSGYESGRCLTGCVATAIAQIMYYHKFPEHGQSYYHIYYPSGDITGQKLDIDYDESYYDWDNMIDSFKDGYNEIQAAAVAKLMYNCGVGCNMIYRPTASAALTVDAVTALKRFFGYADTTRKEDRDDYSDQDWMEKVFTELSESRPFFYGANDVAAGGHAFVIDGYNEDGLVHVNWGWEGDQNGFYDISILNPGQYQFSMNQDAIMGIAPDHVIETIKDNLTLAKCGDLAAHYTDEELMRVKELKLNGLLNSTDIRTLRRMAGVDENGHATAGILKLIDLSGATIVDGGEPYLLKNVSTGEDASYSTINNAVGDFMFAGCSALQSLVLPPSVKSIGDGAFIGCPSLKNLSIPEGDDKDYRRVGNVIYNTDQTQIICLLPFDETAYYELPQGLTTIHDYAFKDMVKLYNIIMPNSIVTIGSYAFDGCASLRQVKLFAKEPPMVGADAFRDVVKRSCTILVRSGSKAKYEQADGWKDFKGTYMNETTPINFDNIKEFGTTIKATNAYREYGEPNPAKFGYKTTGDNLSGGSPVLSCDADELSPVGEYPIHVEAGTITAEAVDFVDGTLFVLPALLTVTANDAERQVYTDDPVFTMSFEGWRNNEDESVLDEMPVVTTTATKESPAGKYPLTVSGGMAQNYEIDYIPGTLIITDGPITEGVNGRTTGMNDEVLPNNVYDLSGRRISNKNASLRSLPKGVYILNKRKVVR